MPSRPLFDRALIARHLERRRPGADDFVLALVLDDLRERLLAVRRNFARAAILGPDPAQLPECGVSATGHFAYTRVSTLLARPGFALAEPEALSLPGRNYDLIVSLFDLQRIEDVPGYLARARAHLAPDGLLLAAAPGGDTLAELRRAFFEADTALYGGAFARVAPFIPRGAAGGLLQRAGLALPVADIEVHVVRYASPMALMREIKALGGANPLAERPRRPAGKALLAAAGAAYERAAADPDGRVRATLEILWLSGWAPHESQQTPLAPGSAEVRLASVLGKPDN